ncbi:hypothetical protein [Streptomyces sp. x-19]|uniref:hypothetical protein n=1 Tax=Streptomyces sp. x-19 TaxID=2789280 RepID=UPI00398086EE
MHGGNNPLPPVVLGLRSGCRPDPEPDESGELPQHMIYGHVYKTARDEDGNHLSAGVLREAPWVAIAPVVHAVRVLERVVPADALLFDHRAHYWGKGKMQKGNGSLRVSTLVDRVEDFVAWANEEASALGRSHEVIPPDPHGSIGTERFRRSLAWHIARRPGGLVALAIQYDRLPGIFVHDRGYAGTGCTHAQGSHWAFGDGDHRFVGRRPGVPNGPAGVRVCQGHGRPGQSDGSDARGCAGVDGMLTRGAGGAAQRTAASTPPS